MAAPLPLDKLDPVEVWKPWVPTAANPWDRKWAAHLYRRAAFGTSAADLDRAVKDGPVKTLDQLLAGQSNAAEMVPTLTDVGKVAAARDGDGTQLRGWWLYCMLQGGHPLREKMALFWHNHFATSLVKVRDPNLMFRQNCLFRTHALGHFGPLLHAVTRDGAMLVWLDSNSNVKAKPNENYARELMELFSLGVGNYTEKDVREAARAFTGWHTNGTGFEFNEAQYDFGDKTVLGKTGPWRGDDIVKIVLEQPAAARFLVRKLYTFFVSEISPPQALLEPLCESFRKSDYEVAALVKTMLSSRHFYSEHAFRKRIKSPVEYALGAVLATYRRFDEDDPHYKVIAHQSLIKWLNGMGQSLFAPPNVKGWPGGRTWLNTATVLERNNFAAELTSGTVWAPPPEMSLFVVSSDLPPPKALDPARALEDAHATTSEAIVDALIDAYMPGGVRSEAREKLVAFVDEDKPTGLPLAHRAREAAHAILTMPEAQLA
ncbi:Uncharacterized protein OS=Singulisphaera acidiphila (strain ATCC BAA-1392 / DSM 18658 / VKM B-2454 / MOB10) GN=Sinac_7507 PE=4 SV=1: DUF1800 [Gemmata massiliana]|uniref:DUF1800 domain-containing protein n=1 Tax=Gemmata massiliana TaxID=1210884 RepID=A0A6P2D8D7_9BACT|nr:DUF1800 domain-containing protein [Gemmata massiliana]VTR95740.1 Uncharacterized protein OS=Singulisphaera acidiphila (strain ATCC BAA-1392 / DSM 18658 / VKM B-2454 / MOB10) GN=Sinac_7507 PE=4 SV=1: DUF1800 [Gemmata massiliana]